MKAFMKYCILLILAVVYLGQRMDATRYLKKAVGQERLISNEKEAFERLAMLTAMNGNALPVNVVPDISNVQPTCRYLQRNSFSIQVEEHKRIFTPYFRYVENDYLDSFALRQDGGYYVFALREIIV